MAKSRRKRTPKTVLKLPDLEQSKSAVLNSLTSASSKRSYEHAIREFIEWYCSEPRLAFNRTSVGKAVESIHGLPGHPTHGAFNRVTPSIRAWVNEPCARRAP